MLLFFFLLFSYIFCYCSFYVFILNLGVLCILCFLHCMWQSYTAKKYSENYIIIIITIIICFTAFFLDTVNNVWCKKETKTHTPKETKKNSESEIFANNSSEKTWERKGCKYKPRFPWMCSLVRTQVFIMLVCRRRPFYPILNETHWVCCAATLLLQPLLLLLCVLWLMFSTQLFSMHTHISYYFFVVVLVLGVVVVVAVVVDAARFFYWTIFLRFTPFLCGFNDLLLDIFSHHWRA